MKKKLFFVFVMFLALGSWAQGSSDTLALSDTLASKDPQKINKFTITTWAGEDLDFVIFDGYFMLRNPDNSWKKLESFDPKELAKPVIIAKPRWGKYDNACEEAQEYLICIYQSADGQVWESFFDIKTKSITSIAGY